MARKNRHIARFVDRNRLYFEDGIFCRWISDDELEELKPTLAPHCEDRPRGQHFLGYKFKPAHELTVAGSGFSEAWAIKDSGGFPVWQMKSVRTIIPVQ